VGLVPFFLFTFLFLLYPSSTIVTRSFQDAKTQEFTLQNFNNLIHTPALINSYWLSIKVSLVTALGGGIFGFLLAYSAIRGGLPPFMRGSLMTFSGVASNFAGVPLSLPYSARPA
jgi:putative spermidine/putrescine transport system permease protein